MLEEAKAHGISWSITPGTQIITLEYAGKKQTYYHQVPSSTSALARYATTNKRITSVLLQTAGISVPHGFRVKEKYGPAYAKEVFESLKKPIVVKPSRGTWGDNITVNITSYPKYEAALALAHSFSKAKESVAVVEEMFVGEEYRILATQQKVIGVLKRVPAHVVGDGKNTIAALIRDKNQEKIRSEKGGSTSHLKIRVDSVVRENVAEVGATLDSVPPAGKVIYLRKVSNISQGGDAIDVTDVIDDSVSEIALRAMRAVPGLSFAGIDFMTQDITKPQTADSYVIIEMNDSPGFDIHDYPYRGKNRHAAREFLYLLFPELKNHN